MDILVHMGKAKFTAADFNVIVQSFTYDKAKTTSVSDPFVASLCLHFCCLYCLVI